MLQYLTIACFICHWLLKLWDNAGSFLFFFEFCAFKTLTDLSLQIWEDWIERRNPSAQPASFHRPPATCCCGGTPLSLCKSGPYTIWVGLPHNWLFWEREGAEPSQDTMDPELALGMASGSMRVWTLPTRDVLWPFRTTKQHSVLGLHPKELGLTSNEVFSKTSMVYSPSTAHIEMGAFKIMFRVSFRFALWLLSLALFQMNLHMSWQERRTKMNLGDKGKGKCQSSSNCHNVNKLCQWAEFPMCLLGDLILPAVHFHH